jgi:hypothetical protein
MKNSKGTTTPLPPSPTTGVAPAYDSVEEIILELWDYCLYLEYEYYRTNDKEVLLRFTFCIGLIQHWEDVYFSLGGEYGIQLHF